VALSHSGLSEAKYENPMLENQRLAGLNYPVFGHVRQHQRGTRTDEALHVLKAIWTTDPVEFHGRYDQIPPPTSG
jgi:alkanesulfonate monooxygenase SsuD/methylene tetrahydromethanopterin reductase-like flavin-dependent oxidoreductase (luciferase family)